MRYENRELPGERAPDFNYFSADPPEERETHLRDYLHILRKYRWVILASLLGTSFFSVIYSFTRTPRYVATATLQIDREISPIMDSTSFWMSYRWDAEFLETQIKLIKSRSMARRVVMVDDELRSMIAPASRTSGADPETAYEEPVGIALSGLAVEPIRSTRLVEVNYYASDPKRAQRLANGFAEQFIQSNQETRYQTTQEATAFLAEQVERLQNEIKNKEIELQRYGSKVEILSPNAQDSIIAQKLEAVASAQIQAQRERIEKEIAYRDLERTGQRSELLNHPLLSQLQGELVALRQRQEELSSKYKQDWPEMILLKRQIEGKSERIREERERVYSEMVSVARNDYEMAMQRERSFASELATQKKQTSELNQNAIYYNTLKLEIDNTKALLDTLLKRQSETGVQARLQGAKTSNISIVDRATLPKVPYSPNHFQNILLGIISGLALGVGAAVLLNYLDNSVKSPDDLYRVAQLPALGVVPKLAMSTKRKLLQGRTDDNGNKLAVRRQLLKSDGDGVPSDFAEAFNLIRSSVLLSSMDNPPHTLLMASCVASEGKTTAVVNLAISLAQTDKNVLLIDADMRRPQLHRIFKVSNKLGLSNVLAGQERPNHAIQKTKVKGLYVMPSGTVPPNPSELLSGRRIRNLIAGCRKVFDMVLIDSPPSLSFADAFHISVLVDGVILVVEAGETPREVLLRGRQRFDEVHARILGVVLNKAEMHKEDYYYYKGYYHYAHYYKDKEEPEEAAEVTPA
ncbi:MAG TPA: polysaccharide biosynthesis tyrosine autokinase [Acidobacteriota bacterium]